MPELPEVETIASDLDKKIKRLTITDFKVLNESTPRLRPLLNFVESDFKSKIVGLKIKKVGRRAKHIVIEIDGQYLLIHLKMTGQLVYEEKKPESVKIIAGGHPITDIGRVLPNKFTRVSIKFDNNAHLFFNDIRRFGWLKIFSKKEYLEFEKSLGVEPLSADFTLKKFEQILDKKKRSTIKQAILDQKHISGIGNIYADESLFLAGIKPSRIVATLDKVEIKKVWSAIPKILRLSIKNRGTSFSDYVDLSGKRGNFIKLLKVYGRKGEKCFKCEGVISKTVIGGRGTHWCGSCQK